MTEFVARTRLDPPLDDGAPLKHVPQLRPAVHTLDQRRAGSIVCKEPSPGITPRSRALLRPSGRQDLNLRPLDPQNHGSALTCEKSDERYYRGHADTLFSLQSPAFRPTTDPHGPWASRGCAV